MEQRVNCFHQEQALQCLTQFEEWVPRTERVTSWGLIQIFGETILQEQAAVLILTTEALQLMWLSKDGYRISRYPYSMNFTLSTEEGQGLSSWSVSSERAKDVFSLLDIEMNAKALKELKKLI